MHFRSGNLFIFILLLIRSVEEFNYLFPHKNISLIQHFFSLRNVKL